MSKIDDIIDQIPAINETLENLETMYYKLSKLQDPKISDGLKIMDGLKEVLVKEKARLTRFDTILKKSIIYDIDSCILKYEKNSKGILAWSDLDQKVFKMAIDENIFARHIGFQTKENLKYQLEENPFIVMNNLLRKLITEWADAKELARNKLTVAEFGEKYTGASLLATLLEDIDSEVPFELRGEALNRMIRHKNQIKEWANAMTAQALLPQDFCLAFFYLIIVFNDRLAKYKQEIDEAGAKTDDAKKEQAKEEAKKSEMQEENKSIESLNNALKVENASLIAKKAELSNEIIRLETKKESGKNRKREDDDLPPD